MKQPYPTYRDSGVEWIGDVPKHWTVAQVRRWFDIVNGGTPSSGEESYWDGETVWLTPDDLGRNSAVWINESRRRITEEGVRNCSARVSPEGSIILSTRAPIGHIAIAAVPAATNQGCRTLVPNPESDSIFAYYSLMASRQPLQSLGKGTTFMELTPTELGGFGMARPPLDEQRSIAAFLDVETAKIDTLISRKQQLIERLAEYRTALITQTVTKGLPPEAVREAVLGPAPSLKESGVEWIGDVPEHWAVQPFRWVLRESLKYGANEAADLDDPGLPRFIRITDIDNTGHLRDETFRSLPVDVAAPYLLQAGDLLFARSGSVGRTFLYDKSWGPCAYAGYLIRARLDPALALPEFISYFSASHSYASWLRTEAIQSTIENVNAERYSRMPIPLPPVGEQQAIISFLDRQAGRIDALAGRVEAAIERLQEYRTALITAAVTGKIDVRDREPVKAGASI